MSVNVEAGVALQAGQQHSRQRHKPGATLVQDLSREARRVAAAILEVLAGARTPAEAATALGVSVPRYYQVESKALRGLLAACEPQSRGRAPHPDQEVTALRQEKERLQREVLRQQALVRAAQRSVGLTPPLTLPPGKSPAKKVRKRKTARALSLAARLQSTTDAVTAAAVPTTSAATPATS